MIKSRIRKFNHWLTTPQSTTEISKENLKNTQLESVMIGIATAAFSFIPIFLARLGASNFQISLLTSLPAITGLFLSIPIGQILQRQQNVVKWYSISRLIVTCRFVFIAAIPFLFSEKIAVPIILVFLGLITIPQSILTNVFSVVMNAIAGPKGRYELMTRRWSILGIFTSIAVFGAGYFLDWIKFPLNYLLLFGFFSIFGYFTYVYAKRIQLTDFQHHNKPGEKESFFQLLSFVSKNKEFITFSIKRLIFTIGLTMVIPLLPIFFVRTIDASDKWIGIFNTIKTAVMFLGYFYWTNQSRKKGSKFVLLWTTLGLAIYPALTTTSTNFYLIALFAGLSGIFQSGLDLVFFDELFKTFPIEYSSTFSSFAQSTQFFAAAVAPFISSFLADSIGIIPALWISAGIQLIGFFLFLDIFKNKKLKPTTISR